MSFKTRVLGLSVLGLAVTNVAILAALLVQKADLNAKTSAEMDKLGREECAKIAKDVYLMLRVNHENLQKQLGHSLNVVRDLTQTSGGVNLSSESVTWTAVDQFTKQSRQLTLPRMQVGNQWLGQNKEAEVASPLVDKVKTLVGGTCTVFQKMNAEGDMLRVCTNVRQKDGARAGEHGMGFAVVANEVRKLAERSNQAAREISTLIKESTRRVQEGAQLSDQTGDSLRQIIQAAEMTAAKIAEIATATAEQASSAGEVSVAIQNIAAITEQSAAGSEEMASSSEELGAQAGVLRELVGRFKVAAK